MTDFFVSQLFFAYFENSPDIQVIIGVCSICLILSVGLKLEVVQ